MNSKKILFLFLILLGIVGYIVIWQEKSESVPSETIKIGFVGPLTEKIASIGESSLAGAELAIKEINEKGGVLGKQLELISEDDMCSPRGLDAFTKLITVDKVVAISGPDCSSSANASLPFAQEKKVPTVIRWASAPNLAKTGDYMFRIYPSDAFQGEFIAKYIRNELGKDKVAILYVNNDWGKGITDVFTKTFSQLGGTIVFSEGVLEDSRDLRTNIQRLKSRNPEIIFTPLHEATGIVGLKQMKEAGINVPIIGGDVFESHSVLESSGASGVMYSTALVSNPSDFQRKVKEETGKDGSRVTAPLGYDSIMVIARAIELAKSTERKDIRDALQKTSYEGISFPKIEFDSDGDLIGAKYEIKVIR